MDTPEAVQPAGSSSNFRYLLAPRSLAIVQAFDQPFRKVRGTLPRMARLGVSHVLVSPPQKSNPSYRWWGRYQPVDFREISGPLGTALELAELCQKAAQRGIFILVDAVLNHMTNHPHWVRMHRGRVMESRLPQFAPHDFHTPPPGQGGRHTLPHLRTDTPWVKEQLRNYLWMLYGLGVRGFRFDAAKHIDPSFFPYALHDMPGVLCFGEMVYNHATAFPQTYLDWMKGYDFPLAHAMKNAFSISGDLRSLVDPEGRGEALWGPYSVPFVNHHDTVRRRKQFAYFRINDKIDRDLAYSYILARGQGIPSVYRTDLTRPLVKAALQFHKQSAGLETHFVHGSKNLLVLRRGRTQLAVLHKGGSPVWFGELACGLAPGIYKDQHNQFHAVDSNGVWQNSAVSGRHTLFLSRQ